MKQDYRMGKLENMKETEVSRMEMKENMMVRQENMRVM